MKIKQYVAFALIGLALGACNKPERGEDPTTVEPEGKMVSTRLAINVPNSIRTYAPGDTDPNATGDEIVANYIDVFIYDDGGSYSLTYYRFLPTAPLGNATPSEGFFNYNTDGDQFLTADFDVREGKKLVYVGINLPDLIVERLKTGYYVNEIYEKDNLIDELIEEQELGGSAEVAFFNTSIVKHNIGDPDGTTGPLIDDGLDIAVNVSRLVAKIVVDVDQTDSWDINGGTILASSLEFAIGQRNNQMFVSPLVDGNGNGGADPNYTVLSINDVVTASTLHPAIQKLQFVTAGDLGDYIPVNSEDPDPKDGTNTNMRYTTENTSELYRHQDVTYVSVRAKFIPHRYNDVDPDNGTLPDDGSLNNTTEISDGFYAVFTGEPDGDDALGVRYFDNIIDARAFVTGVYYTTEVLSGTTITPSVDPEYDEAAVAGESDHYIFFYEDSWCYYRIYLNTAGNYNILRNTVHTATIEGINYLGTTQRDAVPGGYEDPRVLTGGRGTPIYPGDWFPNKLPNTPVLPTAQISPIPLMEGLSVEIEMENWDPVDEGSVDVY